MPTRGSWAAGVSRPINSESPSPFGLGLAGDSVLTDSHDESVFGVYLVRHDDEVSPIVQV